MKIRVLIIEDESLIRWSLRQKLEESANQHLGAGLAYINSGHYEGDHWLATFGLYAVERVGIQTR